MIEVDMRQKTVPLLVMVSALAACTQYWEKPGGTQREFDMTKARCEQKAYADFPSMTQQITIGTGYTTPSYTTCTGSGYFMNCQTTGGNYVPPSKITVDNNKQARHRAINSCLMQNGWKKVK
ncbi:MAG: hypothetical protein ACQEUZ_05030 [Pseudomonadota bacterium]